MMAPSFSSYEVTNCRFIPNVVLRPRPDFAFYHAPLHCDRVDFPDELEAFRGRVEVFILTSISAFIEIVEVDFGHLERVPRAECNCPSAVLGVSFEHKPCHEVVFGSKVRVGSVCRVTLVVTLEEPRQSKDEKIWRSQPGPGFIWNPE